MSGGWSWAGATAAGTSHLAQGLPCQDAFACSVWRCEGEEPVLIAALADGAGSARHAETGAQCATAAFVDAVYLELDQGAAFTDAHALLRLGVEQARLAVFSAAERIGAAADDLASTLLVAVISPSGAALGQIGDGAIVIDDAQAGGWRPVHWPDHGEYANTTSFLTQPDALAALRIEIVARPAPRLGMFSDGLERLLLDFRDRSAHGPFFDSVLGRLDACRTQGRVEPVAAEVAALLGSEKVNSRTDDDKSLLLATWIED